VNYASHLAKPLLVYRDLDHLSHQRQQPQNGHSGLPPAMTLCSAQIRSACGVCGDDNA
jgi:hypothetical protein